MAGLLAQLDLTASGADLSAIAGGIGGAFGDLGKLIAGWQSGPPGDFGSALSAYQKYESIVHVAVCGCNDIALEAHTFNALGKCTACGYTKPGSQAVTLNVEYGVWSGGQYTKKMDGFPEDAKKGQEVTVSAPGWGSWVT